MEKFNPNITIHKKSLSNITFNKINKMNIKIIPKNSLRKNNIKPSLLYNNQLKDPCFYSEKNIDFEITLLQNSSIPRKNNSNFTTIHQKLNKSIYKLRNVNSTTTNNFYLHNDNDNYNNINTEPTIQTKLDTIYKPRLTIINKGKNNIISEGCNTIISKQKNKNINLYNEIFKHKCIYKRRQNKFNNITNLIYCNDTSECKENLNRINKELVQNGKKPKYKFTDQGLEKQLKVCQKNINFMRDILDFSYPSFVLSKVKEIDKSIKAKYNIKKKIFLSPIQKSNLERIKENDEYFNYFKDLITIKKKTN